MTALSTDDGPTFLPPSRFTLILFWKPGNRQLRAGYDTEAPRFDLLSSLISQQLHDFSVIWEGHCGLFFLEYGSNGLSKELG
jgi:hypothetical protein